MPVKKKLRRRWIGIEDDSAHQVAMRLNNLEEQRQSEKIMDYIVIGGLTSRVKEHMDAYEISTYFVLVQVLEVIE